MEMHGGKRKARQCPCHFGCFKSAKRRAAKEVWMSIPTPSPWTDVPEGTTLCSKHYEQALAAKRAHSVVRPNSAPANADSSGASAESPLRSGHRTAHSGDHCSGGGGGGVSGGGEQHANDSHRGGETSGGGGKRLARDNASAAGLPRGEVGQVVEGRSRPRHNAEASGGLRQNAAARSVVF